MCLDQLGDPGSAAGGGDFDEPLEEDDEVRDDLEIDEGEELNGGACTDSEDHHRTHDGGERTSKSDSLALGNPLSGEEEEGGEAKGLFTAAGAGRKGLRIQKKKSTITSTTAATTKMKKPGSKSSKKSDSLRTGGGYNEGAEENKVWLGDNES